ncbi:coiled-coil domain-containing protein [Sediminibacterium soli]|uniref:hypothetical protein n=1 Tax=Sediminibacterium soli TaxID=2698829 RepID=UPI001379C5FB|nr:hypothetical protein [Sediminibacterium soli]NCI45806.1 hypothetical protein [Sediminibacterium soli]
MASIESKAKQIEKDQSQIPNLKRQYTETYSLEAEKLKKLKSTLADLRREKDEALDELRRGRFCNGCSRTASELRRSGVNDVENHFRQNGGTHPASPQQIAQKEAEYDQKIKNAEDAAKAFEFSENEFTRKRTDLDKQLANLNDEIARLRQEITELSQRYKTAVIVEGKNIQANYIEPLMRIQAEKNFIEDRLNIISVKLNDLQSEETKAMADAKDKVARQVDREKAEAEEKARTAQKQLYDLGQAYTNESRLLNDKIAVIVSQLRDIESKLRLTNLPAKESDELKNRQASLQAEQSRLQQELDTRTAQYQAAKTKAEQTIKEQNDKVWELTINLSKRQQELTDELKNAFQLKRKILQDAQAARTDALKQTGDLLLTKKSASRNKFLEWASIVDKERVRLINACSLAGCSCYGSDTHGTVVANYSKAEGCVGEMEAAHHSGDPVYGCEEEGTVYKQYYTSLLNGLSDSDRAALQKKTTNTRYDLILKKVN